MARVEELKQCSKLLQFFLSNKEAGACARPARSAARGCTALTRPPSRRLLRHLAEPFLEPVDWKGWNLLDYPKVIKTPMDLRTVKVRAWRRGAASSALTRRVRARTTRGPVSLAPTPARPP